MPGTHNAYFFHFASVRELTSAFSDAFAFLDSLSPHGRDTVVAALTEEARQMRWDRPGGPLDRYDLLYRLALAT